MQFRQLRVVILGGILLPVVLTAALPIEATMPAAVPTAPSSLSDTLNPTPAPPDTLTSTPAATPDSLAPTSGAPPDSLAPAAAGRQVTHGTVIRAVALGLRHHRGEVRMSIFAKKDGFPDHDELSLQWGRATMAGDSATFLFTPVPAGRYAVSVFHDENGDGSMQKDFLGRPSEGWGVSRDVKARFGPPRFDAAAFDATGDTLTVRLHLRY